MIKVKTKIGLSKISGIGLFADQFIPQGTVTWEYDPRFDTSFTEEDVRQMSEAAQTQFWKYAYFDKDLQKYVLCFDDQRFINHTSSGHNIQSTPRQDTAARDIEEGEELLCNYNDYDDTYFTRLNIDEKSLV